MRLTRWVTILGLCAAMLASAQAVTRTWIGAVDSDWFNGGNWSDAAVPGANEEAIVTNTARSILLTNATANLASFTLTNNILTFSNWFACLTASNVTIWNKGTVTVANAFTTNDGASNRVWIVCTNLTLDAGGKVNADGKGFLGGVSAGKAGNGPGGGTGYGGGGYGGQGGYTGGGLPYGLTNAPIAPGSGGGRVATHGVGDGGGAVRIEAAGTVTVNGTISANGTDAAQEAGGGSGGGIFITCDLFAGSTNGLISANGGRVTDNWGGTGGGGGGGRIAVVYNTSSQTANPGVRFSAAPGAPPPGTTANAVVASYGDGTLYLPNGLFVSENLASRLFWRVVLCIPGMTNWAGDHLMLSDNWLTFQPTNFILTVTNHLAVTNGGLGLMPGTALACRDLTLNNSTMLVYKAGAVVCSNDLFMTNVAKMYVYSDVTNGATADYGALVCATGNVTLAAGSWIYPYSDNTNGGSVLFRMSNLTIAANAGFDADGKGFSRATVTTIGYGPGGGASGGGGGYGGQGGGAGGGYGLPYGSTNAPIHPGSGGGRSAGHPPGDGGGAIRIEASGTVTVNGTITANSASLPYVGDGQGGGSGGGISITCDRLDGTTNGLISANGGNGSPDRYGGGGGRIAVAYNTSSQIVNPGVRFSATPGTPSAIVYYGDGTLYLPNTLFLSENLANRLFWKVVLCFPQAMTNWTGDKLVVSDCWFTFPAAGFRLAFTNQVAMTNGGLGLTPGSTLACRDLTLNNSTMLVYKAGAVVCGNDLLMTNAARMYVYSDVTNAVTADYGALVYATGDLTLAPGCWIYPYADDTNGGSVLFRMNNLTIATNAGFDADGKGFRSRRTVGSVGYGPGGGGPSGGGGGYGGQGGGAGGGYGLPYGSTNAPIHPGSGGGQQNGHPSGDGGGAVRIVAAGTVIVNGTLTANSASLPYVGDGQGGGSGGGIFVRCAAFSGDGKLQANGGNGSNWNGDEGGGGGGRIAVWYAVPEERVARIMDGSNMRHVSVTNNYERFTGTLSVTNGTCAGAWNGNPGSIVFLTFAGPGSVIQIR